MRLKIGVNNIPVELFKAVKIEVVQFQILGYESTINCRLHNSDPEVFKQIFIDGEYNHIFLPKDNVNIIIDAGANVGYSVIFFSKKYPNSKIIAIEPDPGNFKILKKNCHHLKNVVLINAALWSSAGKLQLKFHETGGWGTRTLKPQDSESDRIEVTSITPDDIYKMFDIKLVDIFKIDIEGAEKELFSIPDMSWISNVKLFVLETHDRFCAGSDETVKRALPLTNWEYSAKGENQLFRKKYANL